MSERSLKSWMQTLIGYVRSGQPDLTNRQMALMLLVYLTPGPHPVRGLANILGVSKPVITRALNTLGTLGYLRRVRSWRAGENIAWGRGERATPREIVRAWMESPPHRANVLGRSFRELGVGVAPGAPVRERYGSEATYVHDFGVRG